MKALICLMLTVSLLISATAHAVDKCELAIFRYDKVVAARNAKIASLQAKKDTALARLNEKRVRLQNKLNSIDLQISNVHYSIQRIQENIAANNAKILDPNTWQDLIPQLQAETEELQVKLNEKQQKLAELEAKYNEQLTLLEQLNNQYNELSNLYDQKIQKIEDLYRQKIEERLNKLIRACGHLE